MAQRIRQHAEAGAEESGDVNQASRQGGGGAMKAFDYWLEGVAQSLEEHGVTATEEQAQAVATDVQSAHDNYGMAFYSPPSSDRYAAIERDWKEKLRRLQAEFDAYRNNAETAVKVALRQASDASVSIGEYGEVLRHGGRTEVIQ
jgi:molecular chaperone GrpE (heat shock protein)